LMRQQAESDYRVAKPLENEEIRQLLRELSDWRQEGKQIERIFRFPSSRMALQFVNRVANLAEQERHHPDIHIFYDTVRLVLSTHSVGGLTAQDFSLAYKIDLMVGQDFPQDGWPQPL